MTNSNSGEKLRDKFVETRENVVDMGHLAKEAAKEKLSDLKDRASDTYERGRDKVVEWEEGLIRAVRSAPMKSVLVAAGVGLALGFLCRRS